MSSLSADALYEAAWLANRNSTDFMHDAKLLLKRGSSAHAMGLIVLAEEEFAKGLILSGLACGHFGHREWLRLVMRRHDFKHLATGMTVGWYTLFSLLGITPRSDGSLRLWKRDPADVLLELVDRAVRLMSSSETLRQRLGEAHAELKFLGRMQLVREQAFYVDLRGNGPTWHPSLLSRDDILRYYETASARMGLYAFIESPEELRRWMPPVGTSTPNVELTRKFEHWLFEEEGYRRALDWLRVPPEDGEPAGVLKWVSTLGEMARDPQFLRAVDILKQIIAERRRPAVGGGVCSLGEVSNESPT